MELILLFILCVCIYTVGEDNGKKEATKLVKQYWEEAKDINEFWEKFSMMWRNNVGD